MCYKLHYQSGPDLLLTLCRPSAEVMISEKHLRMMLRHSTNGGSKTILGSSTRSLMIMIWGITYCSSLYSSSKSFPAYIERHSIWMTHWIKHPQNLSFLWDCVYCIFILWSAFYVLSSLIWWSWYGQQLFVLVLKVIPSLWGKTFSTWMTLIRKTFPKSKFLMRLRILHLVILLHFDLLYSLIWWLCFSHNTFSFSSDVSSYCLLYILYFNFHSFPFISIQSLVFLSFPFSFSLLLSFFLNIFLSFKLHMMEF